MATDRKSLVYLAYADKVVKTDDVELAVGDKGKAKGVQYGVAFHVATERELMVFINVIDDGVVVNRWDVAVTPAGTLEIKFWRDTKNREVDTPDHILLLGAGVWLTWEAKVEIVFSDAPQGL